MNYCYECDKKISANATLCQKCHNKNRTLNALNKTIFCIKKDIDYIVEVTKNTPGNSEIRQARKVLMSALSKIKFDLECKGLK